VLISYKNSIFLFTNR